MQESGSVTEQGDPRDRPSVDPAGSDDRLSRFRAAVEAVRPGPFLAHDPKDRATALVAHLARELGVGTHDVDAESLIHLGDPVQTTTAALRDALFLRVRVLKKVFEGRLQRIHPLGADPGPLGSRVPEAHLEVVLETEEDERTLRLEGGFATAFWEAAPQVGDIIQVDTDHPLVVARQDREKTEGRVLEERDLVYRIRFGDVDRSGVPPEPEDDERRRRALPAPLRRPALATGALPVPTVDAMRATDRWAEGQADSKGIRIEPGILLIQDAERLPLPALVALRQAVRAPGAPVVVLQSEDRETVDVWARIFPTAVRLDRD